MKHVFDIILKSFNVSSLEVFIKIFPSHLDMGNVKMLPVQNCYFRERSLRTCQYYKCHEKTGPLAQTISPIQKFHNYTLQPMNLVM